MKFYAHVQCTLDLLSHVYWDILLYGFSHSRSRSSLTNATRHSVESPRAPIQFRNHYREVAVLFQMNFYWNIRVFSPARAEAENRNFREIILTHEFEWCTMNSDTYEFNE
eukprot:COSAG02_NODE_1610_length_11681_cov_11.455103_10_plen_110_part_00